MCNDCIAVAAPYLTRFPNTWFRLLLLTQLHRERDTNNCTLLGDVIPGWAIYLTHDADEHIWLVDRDVPCTMYWLTPIENPFTALPQDVTCLSASDERGAIGHILMSIVFERHGRVNPHRRSALEIACVQAGYKVERDGSAFCWLYSRFQDALATRLPTDPGDSVVRRQRIDAMRAFLKAQQAQAISEQPERVEGMSDIAVRDELRQLGYAAHLRRGGNFDIVQYCGWLTSLGNAEGRKLLSYARSHDVIRLRDYQDRRGRNTNYPFMLPN